MSPSILEMTKKDITRLGIEAAFAISLSLPEVCKPSISSVKIKPTLNDKGDGVRITNEKVPRGQHLLIQCEGKYSITSEKHKVNTGFGLKVEHLQGLLRNVNGFMLDQQKCPRHQDFEPTDLDTHKPFLHPTHPNIRLLVNQLKKDTCKTI